MRHQVLRTELLARIEAANDEYDIVVADGPNGYGKTVLLEQFASEHSGQVVHLRLDANHAVPATLATAILDGLEAHRATTGHPHWDERPRLGLVTPTAAVVGAFRQHPGLILILDGAQHLKGDALSLVRVLLGSLAVHRTLIATHVYEELRFGKFEDRIARLNTASLAMTNAEVNEFSSLVGVQCDAEMLLIQTRGSPLLISLSLSALRNGRDPKRIYTDLIADLRFADEAFFVEIAKLAVLPFWYPDSPERLGLRLPQNYLALAMSYDVMLVPLPDGSFAPHQLFREVFLDTLSPEVSAEMHRRAAPVLLEGKLTFEALRAYMSAGDLSTALRLLYDQTLDALEAGAFFLVEEVIASVDHATLFRFADSSGVPYTFHQAFRIRAARIEALLQMRRFDEAKSVLTVIETVQPPPITDSSNATDLSRQQSYPWISLALRIKYFAETGAASTALTLLDDDPKLWKEPRLISSVALALRIAGRFDDMDRYFATFESSGEIELAALADYWRRFFEPIVLFHRHHHGEAMAHYGATILDPHALSDERLESLRLRAYIHLMAGRETEFERDFNQALVLSERSHPDLLPALLMQRVLFHRYRQDHDAARHALELMNSLRSRFNLVDDEIPGFELETRYEGGELTLLEFEVALRRLRPRSSGAILMHNFWSGHIAFLRNDFARAMTMLEPLLTYSVAAVVFRAARYLEQAAAQLERDASPYSRILDSLKPLLSENVRSLDDRYLTTASCIAPLPRAADLEICSLGSLHVTLRGVKAVMTPLALAFLTYLALEGSATPLEIEDNLYASSKNPVEARKKAVQLVRLALGAAFPEFGGQGDLALPLASGRYSLHPMLEVRVDFVELARSESPFELYRGSFLSTFRGDSAWIADKRRTAWFNLESRCQRLGSGKPLLRVELLDQLTRHQFDVVFGDNDPDSDYFDELVKLLLLDGRGTAVSRAREALGRWARASATHSIRAPDRELVQRADGLAMAGS